MMKEALHVELILATCVTISRRSYVDIRQQFKVKVVF